MKSVTSLPTLTRFVCTEGSTKHAAFGFTWREVITKVLGFQITILRRSVRVKNLCAKQLAAGFGSLSDDQRFFVLIGDEYVTLVEVCVEYDSICAVRLHTTRRVSEWFGNSDSYRFRTPTGSTVLEAPAGYCINAIQTRYALVNSSDTCTQLGVVMVPLGTYTAELERHEVATIERSDMWHGNELTNWVTLSGKMLDVLSAAEYDRYLADGQYFQHNPSDYCVVLDDGERIEAVGVSMSGGTLRSICIKTNVKTSPRFGRGEPIDPKWLDCGAYPGSFICGFQLKRTASAVISSIGVLYSTATADESIATATSGDEKPSKAALAPHRSPMSATASASSSSSSTESLERLTDLASRSFGARVLFATDEWFAAAHRMLLPEPAVFLPEEFTTYGKWMDGWETRRKRVAGHDWCILELGLRGTIAAIDVDTAFFTGNNAPRVSIQAARFSSDKSEWPLALQKLSDRAPMDREMGRSATSDELALAGELQTEQWHEILPFSELAPGYPETRHNVFRIANDEPWTHLRINMFPDGGIARLRVYGNVVKDWSRVPETELVDLVAATNGGQVIQFNDAHYGHPKNLLAPGRSLTMDDGWQTARKNSRPAVLVTDAKTGLFTVPGKDWCVLKLGHLGVVQEIEVDTNHFKGNFPESCVLYGTAFHGKNDQDVLALSDSQWQIVLPRVKLEQHKQHYFSVRDGAVAHVPQGINFVKLEMFPDGGISRLRLRGFKKGSESGSRL